MPTKTDVIEIIIPSDVCKNIKQAATISETLRIKIQNNIIKQMSVTETDPDEQLQSEQPKPAQPRVKLKPSEVVAQTHQCKPSPLLKRGESKTKQRSKMAERSVHILSIMKDRMQAGVLTSASEIKEMSKDLQHPNIGGIVSRLHSLAKHEGLIVKKVKKGKEIFYQLIPNN